MSNRTDTERFDWLEANPLLGTAYTEDSVEIWYVRNKTSCTSEGCTLREAIDAAMKAQKESEARNA